MSAKADFSNKKNETYKYKHKINLNSILNYLLTTIVAVGRGLHFGLNNMFSLAYGVYFAEFATPIGILSQAVLGVFSTAAFFLEFNRREHFYQTDYLKKRAHYKRLKAELFNRLEGNKSYHDRVIEELKAIKIRSKKISGANTNRSWQDKLSYYAKHFKSWYFTLYNRLFASLNSGKDFLKGLLTAAMILGFSVPATISMASAMVSTIFCSICFVFSVCAGVAYHQEQKHLKDQKLLKLKIFYLENQLRKIKEIQKYNKIYYKEEIFYINRKKLDYDQINKKKSHIENVPLETSQQKKFNTMLWVTAAFGLFNGFYFGSVMFAVFTEILFSITVPIAVPIGLALMCGLGWMLQASGNEWQSQNAYHATYQKYHHIKDKYEDAKKSMPKNNLTYEKYLERHSKESMNFKREKKLGDYWVRFIDSTRAVTNITKLALFCLKLTGLAVSLKLGLLGALGILPTLAIFAAAAITGVCILMINSWNEHRHAEIKRFEHEIKLMKDDIVKSKYLPPGESVLSQQKEKSEYHLFQKYLTTRFNNSSFSFWNSLPSKKVALDTKINSSGYCLSG